MIDQVCSVQAGSIIKIGPKELVLESPVPEELIGKTLKKYRDEVIILTKVGYVDFTGKQVFSYNICISWSVVPFTTE